MNEANSQPDKTNEPQKTPCLKGKKCPVCGERIPGDAEFCSEKCADDYRWWQARDETLEF